MHLTGGILRQKGDVASPKAVADLEDDLNPPPASDLER